MTEARTGAMTRCAAGGGNGSGGGVGTVGRPLWLGLGILACGLGFVGIAVPGMPATVFFIAAAACFSRSSPRLLDWVLNLPTVGRLVRNYRAGLGMPLGAKWTASAMMLGAGALSLGVLERPWVRALVLVLLAIGASVIWCRIRTTPRGADASERSTVQGD